MALPKVLVTGGTGFLGSEIVRLLVQTKAYEVTAIDINPPALGTGTFSDVRYVRANILQKQELSKVFHEAKPSIVVHTVGVTPAGQARYSNKGREALFEINVTGTRNVIEVSKECGAKGLVYTSSITVLVDENDRDFVNADETWPTGRAKLLYGQSKTAAENLVLSSNSPEFPTCALRPAPIFGPNDPGAIPTLHGCIARGETPFILGDGSNLQDFVYVTNVADAHVLAVRNLLNSGTAAGQAFFVTNGEPVTLRDFCIAVWRQFDHTPPFQLRIPKSIAWWVGWAAEWATWAVRSETTLSRGAILDGTAVRYVSISKAKRILGYEPKVGLEEAVKITCEHYKQQIQSRAYDKEETLR
ncbi:C-3 sterol dehydrogenase/C-4 decarboxylase-like protein [Lophiostoma macrostomum CBS 122681]|uniref:C-3 sterol dehydrogenase/C-4 decarboxylase-like protein n=1 Tax=Lophiostoma macrostomum CBS 122681 TaxID=1314788 RepID=A0A6A6SNN6_9PLEO|nr:C-3 sterol dehydrogenase/C-4 decarboxylase-like protein [Lophiostoma macrostomum CBS 122681]